MSEGELLQMEKVASAPTSKKIPISRSSKVKPPPCWPPPSASGAWSTTQDETITEKMRVFGEKVGMAFQIKDDLFDYGSEAMAVNLPVTISGKKAYPYH